MTFLENDQAWAGLVALMVYISWWNGLIVIVIGAWTRVLYRREAGLAPQRTSRPLVEKASTVTVVWREKSWQKGAVTVWVEASDSTGWAGSS